MKHQVNETGSKWGLINGLEILLPMNFKKLKWEIPVIYIDLLWENLLKSISVLTGSLVKSILVKWILALALLAKMADWIL